MLVSDLFFPNTSAWDPDKISYILPGYEKNIFQLKPSLLEAENSYVWQGTASGIYQARSGYHAAKESNTETRIPQVPTFNWNTGIWNINTSPKLKLFLWKVVSEALPMGK